MLTSSDCIFNDDGVSSAQVDQDIYITNYIIQKESICVRIHFLTAAKLLPIIDNYNSLHETNCQYFGELFDQFYEKALENGGKRLVFEEEFLKQVTWRLRVKIKHWGFSLNADQRIFLEWEAKENFLKIGIDVPEECIEKLNSDKTVEKIVSIALKDLYKYSGDFKFDSDFIPF